MKSQDEPLLKQPVLVSMETDAPDIMLKVREKDRFRSRRAGKNFPAGTLRNLCRIAVIVAVIAAWPAPARQWEAIHQEMYEALASLSKECFQTGCGPGISPPNARLTGIAGAAIPHVIVIGFTGGMEGAESRASGIVAMKNGLEGHVEERSDVYAAAYNNFHWRRAATDVIEIVRSAKRAPGASLDGRQPLIVVYSHSWGSGSATKFARELKKEQIEVSLAIYIDAFAWRNPRLPRNVRYAVNFYQRAGILNGLPLRGKAKLIPEDPSRTQVLGNYEITPQAGRWGWSWNPLQPLFYRQHHLIAHDIRLARYLSDIVNLKLELLNRANANSAEETRSGLFDRVVILGASVSAGEKAPSPGLLLARHMGTSEEQIFTFAEGGASSDRHLGFLDNIARLRPTLIIALDLFYHDFQASLFLSESRKQYLREYLEALHQTGAAVVVGNIPNLVLLRHQHVNRYLQEIAAELPNLVLVDVQHLIGTVDEGLPLRVAGAEMLVKKHDVFADRVHPNLLGSTLLANYLLDRLQSRFPERATPTGAGDPPGFLPLPIADGASHN